MRTPRPTRRFTATLGAVGLLVAVSAPATALGADCDPLVTHTPSGSQGDRHAVAITSQSLEADRQGWAHVGWEAAEGTTLSEVAIHREEGIERITEGDLATGYAEDALELRFCGEVAGAPEATSPARPDDEAPDLRSAPAQSEPGAESTPPTRGDATTTSHPAAAPPSPAETEAETATEAQERHTAPEARETPPVPGEDEVTPDPDPQDEVEVLGVSLSADGSHEIVEQPPARDADALRAAPTTNPSTTPVPMLVGGLAALLAAAAALIGAHRLQREAKR